VICLHCDHHQASRPRGLCFACYNSPEAREIFGIGDGNTSGHGARVNNPVPPAEPCVHPVGSAERIATYSARAERGELLHHPGDSREVVEPPDNRRGVRSGYERRVYSGGGR